LSTAPTVSAASAAPGLATVCALGPALPAAITNSAPVCAVRSFTAWLIGSVPSLAEPEPRLMLTIRACSTWVAHSIPSMIHESNPLPASLRTLPMISRAPGATPV
jgi:hypothetical protein